MALASITWAEVLVLAPELTSVDTDARTAFLGFVDLEVRNPALGADAPRAKAYLAAHFATAARSGAFAPAGALTSRGVGPASASFAAPAIDPSSLAATSYGREYLRIINTAPALRMPEIY